MSHKSSSYWTILVSIAILASFGFCYYLMVKQNEWVDDHVRSGKALPAEATDIKDIGNGWVEFSYRNQRFMYHQERSGYNGYECIVRIDIIEEHNNEQD